jgi:hypothetical protein
VIDVLRAAWLVETTIGDLVTMQDSLGSNQLERRINEASELLAIAGPAGMTQAGIARQLKLSSRELGELRDTMIVRDLLEVGADNGKWRRKA